MVEIAQTLLLTAVIFFVIQMFIAQPFRVVGGSMESTFEPGQYVLVDRISHLWAPYVRGQVVVLHPPADFDERGEPFIKRIVGVAGDTVEIRDGQVWVNGSALAEPYLHVDPETGTAEPTEVTMDVGSWVVPEGHVLVMGDHRVASSDGRDFGPVPVASIVGRALVRYWPLSSMWIVDTSAAAR